MPWRADLLATAQELVRLRREQPVLRQPTFFAGRPVHPDGTTDLAWFGPDGAPMTHERWHDPRLRTLQAFLNGEPVDGDSLLLVVHGGLDDDVVRLPARPWARSWQLVWDSAAEHPKQVGDDGAVDAGGSAPLTALSLRVYRALRR